MGDAKVNEGALNARGWYWAEILFVGFSGVAFLAVPPLSDAFGLPKESFLKVFLTVCWAALILSWVRKGKAVVVSNGVIGAAGIIAIALGLSVAFSESPHHSLTRSVTLAGPLAFFLLTTQVLSRRSAEWVVGGMVAAGGVVAVIGLLQWAQVMPEGVAAWKVDFRPLAEKMRVYATLGNPNWVAGFLAALVPSGVAAAFASRARFVRGLWVAGAGVMLACIAATRSLGGVAALAAAAMCALIMWVHVEWRKNNGVSLRSRRNVLRVVAAGLVVVAAAGVGVGRPAMESVSEHLRGRTYIWRVSARMLTEGPRARRLLVGSGYGTFELGYLLSQAKHLAQPENAGDMALATNAKHAHNDLLEALIEQGAVGLGAWIFFLVTYFRFAGRSCRESTGGRRVYIIAAASGVAALLTHGLVSFPMKVPATALVLWTLVALTPAIGKGGRTRVVRFHKAGKGMVVWYAGAVVVIGLAVVWSVRPAVASHYAWKGAQWEQRGHLEEAAELYGKGLGLNPRDGELRSARGRMRLVNGDYEGALEDADAAEESLMDPAVYLLRAEALAGLGEETMAATYRRIATMMLPKKELRGNDEIEDSEEASHEDE